ncbi:hypothetical protein NUJ28_17105 [Burkholderia multivorans]|uniref:hypothetical protein n=1 Tax=Burkholderia multivorans TaxID=87883 RepID=UPI000CFF8440|nr:hypothetical protein [Burkholderia multivorans]MDN7478555.1 hypothetical protein [Burkholderia multivorans]PRE00139.1 hypothetical protein C6P91_27040 [Burkholderia multivorans]UXZ63847.1 hypothetical protein NUJ28_17105 [Burkholderia multivorans]
MNTRADDADIDVPGNDAGSGEAGAGALAEPPVKTGRERFAREYVWLVEAGTAGRTRDARARKVREGGAVGTQLSNPAEASVRDRRPAIAGAGADAHAVTAGAAAPQTAQYTSRT